MSLPSLDEPDPGTLCPDCGEEVHVVGYCAVCDDRRALEKRIEDGNEYRRQAQIRLDLEAVRKRTRAHLDRLRTDEDMTAAEWATQEERDAAEERERDEAFHRFREDAEEFLMNAAWADDHSSDVDPGRE